MTTAVYRQFCVIHSKAFRRCFSVIFFESAKKTGAVCGGKITAPMTTGPQSGPRPASSIPAIVFLFSQAFFS